MIQEDIRITHLVLGLYIDRMEKEGFSGKSVDQLKRIYLRLNWWILKNPLFSPIQALTKEEWQVLKDLDHEVTPTWLPCHKKQLIADHQPCNSQSEFCHCAELLRCDILKAV